MGWASRRGVLSETIKQFAGVAVRMGPAAHYFRFDSHFASGPAQNIIFPMATPRGDEPIIRVERSSQAAVARTEFVLEFAVRGLSAAIVTLGVRRPRPAGKRHYFDYISQAAVGFAGLTREPFYSFGEY